MMWNVNNDGACRPHINILGCLDALIVCLPPDSDWQAFSKASTPYHLYYRMKSMSKIGRLFSYRAIQIEARNEPMMEKAMYKFKYKTRPDSVYQVILCRPTDTK